MAYVYVHKRLDTNEIFYVGISGTNNKERAKRFSDRNKWWTNIYNKTDIQIIILHDNISWEEACYIECSLIAFHGRKDLNEGTLVNLTDGGEGSPGKILSEEHRNKIAKSNTGKIMPNHVKLILTNLAKGRKSSEKQKESVRKHAINNKYCCKSIIQFDLEGNFIREWKGIKEACLNLNISHNILSKYLRNKTKNNQGYLWKYK